jgi:hypothetical protein
VPALFAEREPLLAALAVEQSLVMACSANEMKLMTVPAAAQSAQVVFEQFLHGSKPHRRQVIVELKAA